MPAPARKKQETDPARERLARNLARRVLLGLNFCLADCDDETIGLTAQMVEMAVKQELAGEELRQSAKERVHPAFAAAIDQIDG